MQIKCGTDIIEIERMKKAIENTGERFLQTVFTPQEIAYCEARKAQKYQHYAARFAAKEAAFIALSEQIKQEMNWKSFEVTRTDKGKPEITIFCQIDNLQSMDISISHCKEYATANVVAVLS